MVAFRAFYLVGRLLQSNATVRNRFFCVLGRGTGSPNMRRRSGRAAASTHAVSALLALPGSNLNALPITLFHICHAAHDPVK